MTSEKIFGILLAAGLSGILATSCSGGGSGGDGGFGGTAGSSGGMSGAGADPGVGGALPTDGGAGMAGSGATGGTSPIPPGSVGAPCTGDDQCNDANAKCITAAEGWPEGYCTITGCSAGSCPTGSECFQMTSGSTYCLKICTDKSHCGPSYACHSAGACIPACTQADCDGGQVCNPQSGLCEDPPCTPGSCASGLECDTASGKCILSGGGPGPGPGPDCSSVLPKRDCTGTLAYCGELSSFEPKNGLGYEDYPLNGETAANQYRSYARRDMQMLIKYAAAYVACKAASWNTGNGGALGLGDMSEANGAIPGTSIGQPGHPAGTHQNGLDMDIAYFQAGTPDNKLRPICPHLSGGQDQYHCVGEPDKLDMWRSALFLGALLSSEVVRVIGVDGKVGLLVEQAMNTLCAQNWLPAYSCSAMNAKLAYETTDTGKGWYYFHHHHLHVSLTGKLPVNPNAFGPELGPPALPSPVAPVRTPEQMRFVLEALGHADGHAHSIARRIGTLPGLR